ncbi:MAG: acyl carrier protein [Clostridiales bacterium]|nr:acyl carrier protein [Clostridiales bacterium]
MSKVFDKTKEIIIEQLGLEEDVVIVDTTSLMGDLEADSLDAVEVVMALEDEFDIEIPDEDAEKFTSIGDIARYVESKL